MRSGIKTRTHLGLEPDSRAAARAGDVLGVEPAIGGLGVFPTAIDAGAKSSIVVRSRSKGANVWMLNLGPQSVQPESANPNADRAASRTRRDRGRTQPGLE